MGACWEGVFGCLYDLIDVQGGGGGELRGVVVGGQPLRTTLRTISISLQNTFCESYTWRLVS